MSQADQIPAIQALTIVIVRVLAAWWFFTGLAGYMPFLARMEIHPPDEIWFNAYYLFLIVLSALVWFWARPISAAVLPDGADTGIEMSGIRGSDLVSIGSFLIGLYYLLHAAPEMVRNVVAYGFDGASGSPAGWVFILTPTVLTGVALLLMFRARDMGRLFTWLREAGTAQNRDIDPD